MKSRNELINEFFWLTPTHGHSSVGRLAETYVHQVFVDTGYRLDDLRVVIGLIGTDGERESKEPILLAILDDDDDDMYINIFKYIYI